VSSPVTCAVYGVSYFVNTILALLIGVAATLTTFVLGLTGHVFDSPAVQNGFSVALSFANLGFVLAIIVIALATILRNETYGIKKLLWKLVVMAILVNFGLVITRPIVSFSDSMTNYFIQSSSPQQSYAGFVSAITGAFAPQLALTSSVPSSLGNVGTTAFAQGLFSLIFGIVFELLMFVALLTLGVLLLVRYVYLGILLILLPLAWLSWIFPRFSGQWSTWWKNFVKWTFFPALAMFFMWLTFQTVATTKQTGYLQTINSSVPATSGSATSNDPVAMLFVALGNSAGSIILNALDEVLLIGLMFGGLMAASSLAGKAGSTVVGAARSASGAVAGYVGKQSKKGARLGWQKVGGNDLTKRMREGNIGALGKIPIVGGVIKRGASITGRAAESISTNEALVAEAKKKVPKSWDQAKENLKSSMNTEDQFAHLALGVKEGKLKAADMVNGKTAADFLDSNRDAIKRFGQGSLLEDANKLFMSDSNYRSGKKAEEAREAAIRRPAYDAAIAAGKSKEDAIGAADAAVRNTFLQGSQIHDRRYEEAISTGHSPEEAEKMATEEAVKAYPNYAPARTQVADDIKDELGQVVFKKGDIVSAEELMNLSQKKMLDGFSKNDAGKVDVNGLFGPAAALKEVEVRLKNIALYAPQIVPNLVKGMKSPTLKRFLSDYDSTLETLMHDNKEAMSAMTGDQKKAAEMTAAQLARAKDNFSSILRSVYGGEDRSESKGGEGGEDHSGDKK
jgi:hypothetical protein